MSSKDQTDAGSEKLPVATNNTKASPISDLWATGTSPATSKVVSECLSCERWSGTVVMGGGAYLLYSCRKAPNFSTKIVMISVGTLMLGGGAFQGWIQPYFNEYRGWPPV